MNYHTCHYCYELIFVESEGYYWQRFFRWFHKTCLQQLLNQILQEILK